MSTKERTPAGNNT